MFQKPKAQWTEVESLVSNNGVKRSFYLSDGGAFKITRHTDKGEQQVLMGPGSSLADLCEIIPESIFNRLNEALESVKDDIAKTKETRKVASQVARQAEKAVKHVQATKDLLLAQGMTVEQVNALFGIKAS